MKTTKRILLVAILAIWYSSVYAQDYLNSPTSGEVVLGTITVTKPYASYNMSLGVSSKKWWYEALLEQAKKDYPHSTVDIRNMEVGRFYEHHPDYGDYYYGPAVGKVVVMDYYTILSQAIDKALRNVREGSRMAIDQVSITSIQIDREAFKDRLIDMLLDKGYKVVAKDYLEKLYKEQKDQLSGLYNESTTVQGNNFSAVGYFINVKVTETSIRVQVVNVSTGEYEGNATVNF